MGNRAKRVKLAKFIKEQGLGRLYLPGHKRRAWKSLSAFRMDDMLQKLQFKVGDLVNDCDFWNHRIVRWVSYTSTRRGYYDWAGVFIIDQFEREDGCWSCGCSGGPEQPKSREEIETVFRSTPEQIEQSKKDGWWSEISEAIHQTLSRGEHVADEQGMMLPWVLEMRKKQLGE